MILNWLPYSDRTLPADAFSTVAFLVAVVLLRFVLVRALAQREGLSVEARRRGMVHIRTAMLFVFVMGLVFIWAHELRTFAVSLVAFVVAIVIATKELILCLSGAVLRAATNAYSVGDRVQIGEARGDVVDLDMFATTILEIGPGKGFHQYTGRALVVPNSVLLNTPVVNEAFMGDYAVHVISVPLALGEDWRKAEGLLLEAAHAECASFIEDARSHMRKLEHKQSLDAPSVEPRISLEIAEPGRINLLLRIPSPARRKGRVEQAILRRFMDGFYPPGAAH